MDVDGLFAQPQHPASAPRVRAFAERALKEILSGERDNSLLYDKDVFSEFMYKVTESVLLGHSDPPTAASVISGGENSDNDGENALDAASGFAPGGQHRSEGHNAGVNTLDWSLNNARQTTSVRRPHARELERKNRSTTDVDQFSSGRRSEAAQHQQGHDATMSGMVRDSSPGGRSLLEELRRWRSQAQDDVASLTSAHVPSPPVLPPPPSSRPVPRRSSLLNARCPRHARKANPQIEGTARPRVSEGITRSQINGSTAVGSLARGERRAMKMHTDEGVSGGSRAPCEAKPRPVSEDPPRTLQPRLQSDTTEGGFALGRRSLPPPRLEAADRGDVRDVANADLEDAEPNDTSMSATDRTQAMATALRINNGDATAKAAIEAGNVTQRACGLSAGMTVSHLPSDACPHLPNSGKTKRCDDGTQWAVGCRAKRAGQSQGSECVGGKSCGSVYLRDADEDDPLETSLDLSACSDEKLGKALATGPRRLRRAE